MYSRSSCPASVPCWYWTPETSAFSIACISNLTNSKLMALMWQTLANLWTQVMILAILLCKEGGNPPLGRCLLRHLGLRYRVWRVGLPPPPPPLPPQIYRIFFPPLFH